MKVKNNTKNLINLKLSEHRKVPAWKTIASNESVELPDDFDVDAIKQTGLSIVEIPLSTTTSKTSNEDKVGDKVIVPGWKDKNIKKLGNK